MESLHRDQKGVEPRHGIAISVSGVNDGQSGTSTPRTQPLKRCQSSSVLTTNTSPPSVSSRQDLFSGEEDSSRSCSFPSTPLSEAKVIFPTSRQQHTAAPVPAPSSTHTTGMVVAQTSCFQYPVPPSPEGSTEARGLQKSNAEGNDKRSKMPASKTKSSSTKSRSDSRADHRDSTSEPSALKDPAPASNSSGTANPYVEPERMTVPSSMLEALKLRQWIETRAERIARSSNASSSNASGASGATEPASNNTPSPNLESLNPALLCLFSTQVPRMSFADYLKRLLTYCYCSLESHVMALLYLGRLERAGLPLTPKNIHRTHLACVVLAIKYREEYFYPLGYYAQCGGVTVPELRAMELECFKLLGFDCGVSAAEMLSELSQHA